MTTDSANKTILSKMWLGEYPLRSAFWVHFVGGFVGLILSLFIIGVFKIVLGFSGLPIMLMALVLSWSYLVLTLVGAWRSATNYPSTRLWPNLTKMVIVGFVVVFVGGILLGIANGALEIFVILVL